MEKAMSSDADFVEIGRRVRAVRKMRGLTLEQVSKQAGISPSYISQIEHAKRNLNLRVLREVARVLDVPLVDFLQDGQAQEVTVIRLADRRSYTLASGAVESLLFGRGRENLEVTIMDLPPGKSSGEPNIHQGEEFTLVLRGRVRVFVEGSKYDLDEGDIIYYKSSQRHSWENLLGETCQFLITNTPATY